MTGKVRRELVKIMGYTKAILLFVCVLVVSSLGAEAFYEPNFTLPGHTPVSNNRLNYYNNPRGLSLIESHIYFFDALKPRVEYVLDHENESIKIVLKNGNIQLGDPVYTSFETYLNNMFSVVFEREFDKLKKQMITPTTRASTAGLIPDIVIKLPTANMPRAVRHIMGSGTGRLNLTGSLRVSIAGSRTVRETNFVSEYGSNDNFDITMKQDLNMNLRGTIGEKISVTMKYNSNQETAMFDPNNIHIMYTGDEDEIVQSVEAGNTSLSISGSRYVGYSGNSQGLFGVKARFKLGNLSITAVASKEESQKQTNTYRGSSRADSTDVSSRNFSRFRRYYIHDPREVFVLYGEPNYPPAGVSFPEGWRGNAIWTENGSWVVKNSNVLPMPGTVKVFRDDHIGGNDDLCVDGSLDDDASATPTMFKFDEFLENVHFTVDYTTGIITILENIIAGHTIGVVYTTMGGDVVGDVSDPTHIRVKPIKRRNQTVAEDTWILQLRNIYDLNMRNVQNEGFFLEVYTELPSGERNYFVPEGDAEGMTYNEYLRLDTDGNGVVNGSDVTVNLATGLVIFPFINPFGSMPYGSDTGLGDQLMYERENVNETDCSHYIFIKGRIGQDSINLGFMILPGSVKVRVNGREMQENIDYLIDYDSGRVTFLTAEGRDVNADIQIDYENRPMFAIESKTLLGFRADWKPHDMYRLGGTFIYQSETITDKRPKLGNESRSLILANIDGEVVVEPPFLTTMVDWLPFIKTDAKSRVSLSGEVAMNIPNIQGSDKFGDGTEAWIDDMESVVDAYPLGIMRPTWSPASEPYEMPNSPLRGVVNWFNPNTVYQKDVYPEHTLSEKAKDEKVSVLDLKIIPPPADLRSRNDGLYGGLMKYIGNQIDLSEKEYIEVLVYVDSLSYSNQEVMMYIELGDVSEDFYVEFGGRGILNTEDGTNGGQLDNKLEWMEDVGLSMIPHGQPGHDPYSCFSNQEINGEFPFINGTCGNGKLDTEDLNGNGNLDTLERFLRFPVMITDTNSEYLQSDNNGWRVYRIPLKKNEQMSLHSNGSGVADLETVSYARIWFETPVVSTFKIRLVYIDVIGNKWKNLPIVRERRFDAGTLSFIDYPNTPADRDAFEIELEARNEYFSIGTLDNQKSSKYVAPHKFTEKGTDGEISFEQSLMINYYNIQEGHFALAQQKFRTAYNLLTYNKLRYFVYVESLPEAVSNPDSVRIIFRLGADVNNYYEISHRLPVNSYANVMDANLWVPIEIAYNSITTLKSFSAEKDTLYFNETADIRYVLKGRPTLTNIREIVIGIEVEDRPFTGTVFFNEIRVADPNESIGYAGRATLDVRFADFSTLRVDVEHRSADFYNTTSRTQASATNIEDKTTLTIANNYNLDKFFPTSWGLRFPLNLSYSNSEGIPRYKSSSDMRREVLSPEEQDREINRTTNRRGDSSLSMTKNPTNKLLLYTVRNISVSGQIGENITTNATKADTVVTYRYNGSYNLSLPTDSIRLKLFRDYYWFYFPKSFNNSAVLQGDYPKRWIIVSADSLRPAPQTITRKWVDTTNEITYDIFSDMTSRYRLTTKRDLMDRQMLGSVNVGRETNRNQEITYNYTPFYLANLLNPQLSASASYTEQTKIIRPQGVTDPTPEEITYRYDGSVSRSIRVNGVLKNSDFFTGIANKIGAASNRRFQANQRESGQGFDPIDDRSSDDKKDSGDFGESFGFDPSSDFMKDSAMGDRDIGRERDRERDTSKEEEQRKEAVKGEEKRDDKDGTKETDADSKEKEKEPKIPSSLLANAIGFIGKVQNINLSYENSYSTSFTDYERTPQFQFQMGIPNTMRKEDLNGMNLSDSYSASTGMPLLRNLVTDMRYSYQIQRSYSYANTISPDSVQMVITSKSESITTVWPDVRLTLSGFESLIKAEKLLSGSRLQSAYSYREQVTNQGDTKTIAETHSFAPLLAWNGTWFGKVTSNLSANITNTKNSTDATSSNSTESMNITYSANLGYSFTGTKGIKLPFLKKRFYFQNQMQLELLGTYGTEKSTRESPQGKTVERDLVKYTITPRGSYNFSRNIKGGMSGNYEVSTDRQSRTNINIFKLDLWVELTF